MIGGYAYEFYFRIGRHYQTSRFADEVAWYHEPHVAEQVFREMLSGAGVKLFERAQLREGNGVRKQGTRVESIETGGGDRFEAAVFIDSSYEGDLMAQAGVTWTWGRESSAQYGESLAGVRDRTPFHQFLVNVSAKDGNGRLLPEISSELPGLPGLADKAVQAYNFRMCFSEAPDRVRFAKPDGYLPHRYELLSRLIDARTKAEGRTPPLETLLFIGRLPNGATDVNNNGAFSTDYIGGSWSYPNASYAEREKIWPRHQKYTAGFFTSWLTTLACRQPFVPKQAGGDLRKRVHRFRSLAAPALHPRGSPNGGRIRDGAERSADGSHQKRPYRHGLIQQRFAQR